MLFNSLEFMLFLPIVFVTYWYGAHRSLRLQNGLIVAASYVFYGWWDWRFLSLIIISSVIDFGVGLGLAATDEPARRKALLGTSVMVNLGFLGFFKYYNFFVDSLVRAGENLGLNLHPSTLQIVLPVGISFYTFQTLSYTIDVYHRKCAPTRDVFAFFAFVSFFPQLVAGPIERAKDLLPQFLHRRRFDLELAKDGTRQILWGLTKKILIADNLAASVDTIFANYESLSSLELLIGALLFSFQIYGDFSGYSDIALGTARLFGFELRKNFDTPYFSRNISEFWRRWHISLSSWFRDYLWIPLGGNVGSTFTRIKNIVITFTVSGLWHGASWNFVAWGLLHAVYYVPSILLGSSKGRRERQASAESILVSTVRELMQIGTTFLMTMLAWIFFRAPTLSDAVEYLTRIASLHRDTMTSYYREPLALIAFVVTVEWIQRSKDHPLQIDHLPNPVRWLIYLALIFLVLLLGRFGNREFIYFQF